MAGAAQAHAAAGHPYCGWLRQARSKPLSQHSTKRNHQPDRETGDCFSSNTAHTVSAVETAVEKHAAAP